MKSMSVQKIASLNHGPGAGGRSRSSGRNVAKNPPLFQSAWVFWLVVRRAFCLERIRGPGPLCAGRACKLFRQQRSFDRPLGGTPQVTRGDTGSAGRNARAAFLIALTPFSRNASFSHDRESSINFRPQGRAGQGSHHAAERTRRIHRPLPRGQP